jgi:hypothetical protein
MSRTTHRWVGRAAVVALVAAAVLMIEPLPAATGFCDNPEQLGTCPPFTSSTCNNACILAEYPSGGSCVAGCCTCFTR